MQTMDRMELVRWATELVSGRRSADEFVEAMAAGGQPPRTASLEDASLDLDRARRCGFPEVVFGEGKSVQTLVRIVRRLAEAEIDVLVTRVTSDKAGELTAEFPTSRYNEVARTFRLPLRRGAGGAVSQKTDGGDAAQPGFVPVVTAGSSDRAVAEEAVETLDWMGVSTRLIQDVGVAGPHRLPEKLGELAGADAVIVVAGMEGALPSVVGGYVPCPVIGVPTSVGYGANFGGLSALLSMLNSCAANVVVVNIDAGFKAGYVAGMIASGKTATRRD